MNLLERLKPEARKYLERTGKRSPTTYEAITTFLTSTNYPGDLTISKAFDLWVNSTDGTKPFDPFKYYELFNDPS